MLGLFLPVFECALVESTVAIDGEVSTLGKLWTEQELSASTDLLLVVVGEVFDVKGGEKYYEGEEGYSCFIRKDRTRAFISGNFTEDETSDISDLNEEQCLGIMHWLKFYRNHETYKPVGFLIGTFWDARGKPTPENLAFQSCVARGEAAKAKERRWIPKGLVVRPGGVRRKEERFGAKSKVCCRA